MKRVFLFAALCLFFFIGLSAQQRRTAVRKSVSSAANKTTTPKVSNKYAILNLVDDWVKERPCESATDIYFFDIYHSDANTLRAVNKETGEVRIVIPRKTRNRPRVLAVGCDSKDLYLLVADKGIVKYDGQSVQTSPLLLAEGGDAKESLKHNDVIRRIIFSPNGKYAALVGEDNILIDVEKGFKPIRKVSVNHNDIILLDDGTMVVAAGTDVIVFPFGKPAKVFSKKDIGNGGEGEAVALYFNETTKTLYVAMGEQVLKTQFDDIDNIAWKEAFLLPGENKHFIRFAMNAKHAFGQTSLFDKQYYDWSAGDLTSTPVITKTIKTDVVDREQWKENTHKEEIYSLQEHMFYDQKGNLWLQRGDGSFVIYNPDGISGLTQLKGKVVYHRLPPVD